MLASILSRPRRFRIISQRNTPSCPWPPHSTPTSLKCPGFSFRERVGIAPLLGSLLPSCPLPRPPLRSRAHLETTAKVSQQPIATSLLQSAISPSLTWLQVEILLRLCGGMRAAHLHKTTNDAAVTPPSPQAPTGRNLEVWTKADQRGIVLILSFFVILGNASRRVGGCLYKYASASPVRS